MASPLTPSPSPGRERGARLETGATVDKHKVRFALPTLEITMVYARIS